MSVGPERQTGGAGFRGWQKHLQTWLGHLLVGLLLLTVVNVVWQIVSRYVVGQPSPITEELARFLLIWLGLLGGAYAASFGDHIALDLLPMPSTWRRRVQSVSIGALGLLLLVGGWRLVHFVGELEQQSPALGVPLAWVYLAAPIAGLLMIAFAAGLGWSTPEQAGQGSDERN